MSKRIEVDLNRQVLIAYDGDKQVYLFDCASGDSSHKTPTGHWTVLRKVNPCFSTEYKVQMDHALFFTNRGHAIHQSHAVGLISYLKYLGADSFGSHGCVRLSEDDATTLYNWTPRGTSVWVHD